MSIRKMSFREKRLWENFWNFCLRQISICPKDLIGEDVKRETFSQYWPIKLLEAKLKMQTLVNIVLPLSWTHTIELCWEEQHRLLKFSCLNFWVIRLGQEILDPEPISVQQLPPRFRVFIDEFAVSWCLWWVCSANSSKTPRNHDEILRRHHCYWNGTLKGAWCPFQCTVIWFYFLCAQLAFTMSQCVKAFPPETLTIKNQTLSFTAKILSDYSWQSRHQFCWDWKFRFKHWETLKLGLNQVFH